MNWQAWMISAVVMMVIEMTTPGVLFFACISFGAFCSGLLALVGVPLWLPWAVFAMISVASIYFLRPFVLKFIKSDTVMSNVDALRGKKAVLSAAIVPPAAGQLKIQGEVWMAKSSEAIDAGVEVIINSIEGTHLIVERAGK